MNSVDFCFWLQGYIELANPTVIPPEQLEIIKNHLSLVFVHEIDPLRESETPTTKEVLDSIHSFSPGKNDTLYRC